MARGSIRIYHVGAEGGVEAVPHSPILTFDSVLGSLTATYETQRHWKTCCPRKWLKLLITVVPTEMFISKSGGNTGTISPLNVAVT